MVSAELWRSMFDPQQGFVNYLLTSLHLPLAHTTWLDGTWTAWTAILIADAWRNTPFIAIVLLAGLQAIPGDIYEAARIDGASAWRTFRKITLPLLKPALMVALIFRTLQSFLVFDVVYIMTSGGPGTATNVLAYLDWKAFLVATDFGYGGAVSVALVGVRADHRGDLCAGLPDRAAVMSAHASRAAGRRPLSATPRRRAAAGRLRRADDVVRGGQPVPVLLDRDHLAEDPERDQPGHDQPAPGAHHLEQLHHRLHQGGLHPAAAQQRHRRPVARPS